MSELRNKFIVDGKLIDSKKQRGQYGEYALVTIEAGKHKIKGMCASSEGLASLDDVVRAVGESKGTKTITAYGWLESWGDKNFINIKFKRFEVLKDGQ